MGVIHGAGEGTGVHTVRLGARDIACAAELRDGRCVHLTDLKALPGKLLRESLPACRGRLDDHQDAASQAGKLSEEAVYAVAGVRETEFSLRPVRCSQDRFVRRAASQIDADCPRWLARGDSPNHVRHALHPASSDSGLSPHTTGPMNYSKRRLTYIPAARDKPRLPGQPNSLAGLRASGSVPVVMTAASIGASKGGGYARYLESKTVEHERGDYYLSPEGEPTQAPGQWLATPDTVARLGIEGSAVEGHDFIALMEGKHPRSGRFLRRAGSNGSRAAGIDLTFSAPKSVSAVWALAGETQRREIEAG